MQVRKLGIWRVTGLALCGVIAVNVPAQALWNGCLWLHPCKDDPGSTLTCEPFISPPLCWCEADWDDELNWNCFGPNSDGGYPDLPSENARFRHSNTGYCNGGSSAGQPCDPNVDCPGGTCVSGEGVPLCSGGSRDGLSCNPDVDCPGGSCDDREQYLKLQLTTEFIGVLRIETQSTTVTNDKLEVRLESKGSSAKTLTPLRVILDATNGPITLKISDSATLKTDTTD